MTDISVTVDRGVQGPTGATGTGALVLPTPYASVAALNAVAVGTTVSGITVAAGVSAYVTNIGMFTNNGTSWNPSVYPIRPGTTVGLVGDSLSMRGCGSVVGSGSCTIVVTSSTEVQITQAGHCLWPGNKVLITWANNDLLNGLCATITRLDTSTPANVFYIANPGITGTYPITIGTNNPAGVGSTIGCWSLALQQDVGYASWITAQSSIAGQQFIITNVNALPGGTSAQVLQWCAPKAATASTMPDEFWYLTGANDIPGPITPPPFTIAQTISNCIATVNALKATGKLVRIFTPSASNTGYWQDGQFMQSLRAAQINNFGRDKQVVIEDLSSWVSDPLSTTNAWVSGYNADTLHPTATGCYAAAQGFYRDTKAINLSTQLPFYSVTITDSSDPVASSATTLSSGVTSTATTLPLASASNYPTSGGAVIISDGSSDAELCSYTGVSGNSLTGVTRSAYHSAVQAHSTGSSVKLLQMDLITQYGNLMRNTMLTGTGGSGVISGTIADGYQVYNNLYNDGSFTTLTGTAQVARSSLITANQDTGVGYLNKIDFASSGVAHMGWFPKNYTGIEQFINANLQTLGGGWFQFGFEFWLKMTTGSVNCMVGGCVQPVTISEQSASLPFAVQAFNATGANFPSFATETRAPILTNPFYIPTGTFVSNNLSFALFGLRFKTKGACSGYMYLGRPTLRRISL